MLPNERAYHLKMFILDNLVDRSVERLVDIIELLNDPDPDMGYREYLSESVTEPSLATVLEDMVRDGLIVRGTSEEFRTAVHPSLATPGEPWYGITEKGRRVWKDWKPPWENE